MNPPNKPTPHYWCPRCHKDTPHYIRANRLTALCVACDYERPVGQLVQALPINQGGPEKRV